MHVLLVQERLSSAGRELYALLPALITSAGQGSAALLPGSTEWPKPGNARLVGQKMRLAGRPLCLDDSALVAMVAQLRGNTTSLPPTVWDRYAASEPAPIIPIPHTLDHMENPSHSGQPPIWPAAEPAEPAETRDKNASIRHADVTSTRETVPGMSWVEGDQNGTKTSSLVAPGLVIPPAPLAFDADHAARPVSCSASQHDQATTLDVKREPAEQLSRHAALLRAAVAAGHADTPLPTVVLPGQSNPGADEQVPLLGQDSPQASVQGTRQARQLAEPENGFPVGPAPLGRAAMAELMARVAIAPAITVGQANEVGVTKNRLVELLKGTDKAQAKELAEWLMAWFDLAGLLAEPDKPGRLRHPRALTTTNLTEIAALLSATPCPDRSTMRMLWERSNERQE